MHAILSRPFVPGNKSLLKWSHRLYSLPFFFHIGAMNSGISPDGQEMDIVTYPVGFGIVEIIVFSFHFCFRKTNKKTNRKSIHTHRKMESLV